MSKAWADEILAFWYEELEVPKDWFAGGEELDTQIRLRFESRLQEEAKKFDKLLLPHEKNERYILARIILFDQFPRSIYRGKKEAFAFDEKARSWSKYAVSIGADKKIPPTMRGFMYMPFEHSENLEDQYESLRVFRELETLQEGMLEWAEDHFNVIKHFGRFPHRNRVLGRTNTTEEDDYLKEANTYGQ